MRVHTLQEESITSHYQQTWQAVLLATENLRGVGVAVVVRKTRVTFRPMVMGELENRFPGPSHPGVCLGRIRSGQSGNFLRGQGLKKVQAKAVKMKLTHLRREARKKVAIVQRGVVGENGRNYVL